MKMNLYLGLILLLVATSACKTKSDASADLESLNTLKTAEIERFKFEPDPLLNKELAMRVGCSEADVWLASVKKPLKEIVTQIKLQRFNKESATLSAKSPFDFLSENIFNATIPQCTDGVKKATNDGIEKLYASLQAKGFSLTVVAVGGLGSHLTETGALALSRASWAKKFPAGTFRSERVECTPNSYSDDDRCAPIVKDKIHELMKQEQGKPHMYLLWGYSKGGTTATQVLATFPELREKTVGLVTAGSPFGGGIPMEMLLPIIEKMDSQLNSLSLKNRLIVNGLMMTGTGQASSIDALKDLGAYAAVFSPNERPHTIAGIRSLLMEERAKFLRETVKNWDFTRKTKHPLTGGYETPIFHLGAIADITKFKMAPHIVLTNDSKVSVDTQAANTNQAAELTQLIELSKHPLADMCVALEHAVIPPEYLPKGAKNSLLGMLKMDHMGLSFSNPDKNSMVPNEAIVDSVIDVVYQRLGGIQ